MEADEGFPAADLPGMSRDQRRPGEDEWGAASSHGEPRPRPLFFCPPLLVFSRFELWHIEYVLFCFILLTLPPSSALSQDVRCVTFKMLRCRYCATEGQSLQHIAAYWWGADWIQIWGANSFIRNPNKMRPNELLTLGPTYIVKV